jgi:hypothetical protein
MSAAKRVAWLAAIAASVSLAPDARAQTRAQQLAQEALAKQAEAEATLQPEGRPVPTPTAEGDKTPAIRLNLAQAGVPGSMPWEEPAVVSYRIDRDGKDTYDVQLDGSMDVEILQPRLSGDTAVVAAYLGPSFSYKGSNASDARSDDLTLGLLAKFWRDQFLFRRDAIPGDALFFALTGDVSYKRKGIYPDRSEPPCDTDTTSVFCRKQFSELLTANVDFYPYFRAFEGAQRHEDGTLGMRYSIRPRLELAGDSVLDAKVDPATGLKVSGDRLSALAGLGVELWPTDRIELNATAAVRQRVTASRTRTDVPDKTEGRMQFGLTYHLLPLNADSPWKAGLSVVWTEGGDSFSGDEKESSIVLALRVGHF